METRLGNLIARSNVQAVLPNLDRSISPAACRDIVGWPELRVKSVLRTIAIELYHHEKNSQIWRSNCMDGRNGLLYWVNRIDVEKSASATSSIRTAIRHGLSLSPERIPTKRQSRHKDGSGSSARTRPVTYATLAEFESLYYMTCIKILQLYLDMQTRFSNGFFDLEQRLHERGEEPSSRDHAPFTMGDMAELLRIKWTMLMNPMLISTLDRAIREMPEEEQDRRVKVTTRYREHETYDEVLGLANVNRKPEVSIINMVTARHERELQAAIRKKETRELLRATKRAEVDHSRRTGEWVAQQSRGAQPNDSAPTVGCICEEDCFCRFHCVSPFLTTCICKTNPYCHQLRDQREADKVTSNLLEREHGEPIGEDHLLHAPTNGIAQLQVATWGSGCSPVLVQAGFEVQRTLTDMETEFVHNKLISEGVMVPKPPTTTSTKTPTKKVKDPYPLGLYDNIDLPKRASGNGVVSNTNLMGFSSIISQHSSPLTPNPMLPTPPPTTHKGHTKNQSLTHYNNLLDLAPAPPPLKLSESYLQEQVMYPVFPLNVARTNPNRSSSSSSQPTHISDISPIRPLNIRRYVSAGGPGPIHDRPETEYPFGEPKNAQTFTMSKEAFDRALDAARATPLQVQQQQEKEKKGEERELEEQSQRPPVPPKNPARYSPKSDRSDGTFELKGDAEMKRSVKEKAVKMSKKLKRTFSHN